MVVNLCVHNYSYEHQVNFISDFTCLGFELEESKRLAIDSHDSGLSASY